MPALLIIRITAIGQGVNILKCYTFHYITDIFLVPESNFAFLQCKFTLHDVSNQCFARTVRPDNTPLLSLFYYPIERFFKTQFRQTGHDVPNIHNYFPIFHRLCITRSKGNRKGETLPSSPFYFVQVYCYIFLRKLVTKKQTCTVSQRSS